MRTVSIAIIVTLLLASPLTGFAQQDSQDLLAYTPTGDALWDAYATAVLKQLAGFEQNPGVLTTAGLLPEDLLDSWEPQFGSDPRYWELRYWTIIAAPITQAADRFRATGLLERAVELGVADANTIQLLYVERRHALEQLHQQVFSLDPAVVDASQITWVATPPPGELTAGWFEEQEFALARWQAEACPDEAWAHYNLAWKHFEYGEWEAGLAALELGTAAPRAVMPQPFPLSFYLDRTAAGDGAGSEALAGLLAGYATMWALPNFGMLKEHLMEQQLRVSLGADWRELAAWYGFSCRLGQMGRATAAQQLTGIVLLRLSLKPLLVDVPGELSETQREAVLSQYTRTSKVKDLIKYELREYQPDLDRPPALLASGNAYWATVLILLPGVVDGPGAADGTGAAAPGEPGQAAAEGATQAELSYALSWAAQCVRAEFGDIGPAVREQFADYARFDFATLTLPEEPETQPGP